MYHTEEKARRAYNAYLAIKYNKRGDKKMAKLVRVKGHIRKIKSKTIKVKGYTRKTGSSRRRRR